MLINEWTVENPSPQLHNSFQNTKTRINHNVPTKSRVWFQQSKQKANNLYHFIEWCCSPPWGNISFNQFNMDENPTLCATNSVIFVAKWMGFLGHKTQQQHVNMLFQMDIFLSRKKKMASCLVTKSVLLQQDYSHYKSVLVATRLFTFSRFRVGSVGKERWIWMYLGEQGPVLKPTLWPTSSHHHDIFLSRSDHWNKL